MMLSPTVFRKRFDTSIIEPQATDKEVEAFILRCMPYAEFFAGLAFNIHQIPLAVSLLEGTGIGVAAPLAYPLGGLPTEIKLGQVEYALAHGATQIDVCMAIEALRMNDFRSAERDASEVVAAAKGKVEQISLIPDTGYLTKEQQLAAAQIVYDLDVTYKTNTGFGLVTKVEDVRLVRDKFGERPHIMVSGGCRTLEEAVMFFDAGANKIATSSPFSIFDALNTMLRWQQEAG